MQKVAIVTGTKKGLGSAIAKGLQEENYYVAMIDKDYYAIEEKDNYSFIPCDISNKENVDKVIDIIFKNFKHIDLLVNNAGIINLKPLLQYSEKDYENIFDVNVKGAFLIAQKCISKMIISGGGYIINIGSTRSITGAPNKSLYSMSKFALRSLSQCINSEFKDHKIYSTILCPGALDKDCNNPHLVQLEDVVKTIRYLVKLSLSSKIPEIIIGGML